jgi:excisionase family DNA binding protein
MNDENSITLSQAAEILGISIPTIRRLVSTGRLKAEKQLVGDRLCWRVHKEEVVRFQSERKDQVGEHREQRKARKVNDERVSEQGAELVPLVAHLDLVRVLEETQLRLLDVTERAHRAERQGDLMRMELMATWCGRVLPECKLVIKPLFFAPSRFADDIRPQTLMVTDIRSSSGGDGSCRKSRRI